MKAPELIEEAEEGFPPVIHHAIPAALPMTFDAAVSLDTLRLHPQNPNNGDVLAIEESLAANGFYGALLLQVSSRYILAGNNTYKAARAKGMRTAPVLWIDVADDTALNIMLSDNATAARGERNPYTLAGLLQGIEAQSGTIKGTGYTGDDMTEILFAISGKTAGDAPQENKPRKSSSGAAKRSRKGKEEAQEEETPGASSVVAFILDSEEAAESAELLLIELAARFKTDREGAFLRALVEYESMTSARREETDEGGRPI